MAGASAAIDHTSFFLRKLHSLTGIIPIGGYLCLHLWENSFALVSPAKYDEVSRGMQTIPWRVPVEIAVLGLPILYHALYGFYVWWTGKVNVSQYPWVGNIMYTFQRWTGLLAFFFIAWHVWTARILGAGKTTYEMMSHELQNPWFAVFYALGVTACAIHFGVGIWNFACKWGVASNRRAQRLAGWVGMGIAMILTVMGVMIVLGFRYNWHPFDSYL